MISFKPRHGARLGDDWSGFTGGLTSGMAKDIVREAEPATRRLIAEQRHQFAGAVINGLPYFGLSVMIYLATRYFVPDDRKNAKGVGYLASAAAAAGGGLYTAMQLRSPEDPAATPPGTTTPGTMNTIAQNTAKAIVAEAEPKIRAIVDDERARLAAAGKAMIPFAVGSVATFLATWLLVSPDKNLMKAAGYAGSAALLGTGMWIGLEKEREAA